MGTKKKADLVYVAAAPEQGMPSHVRLQWSDEHGRTHIRMLGLSPDEVEGIAALPDAVAPDVHAEVTSHGVAVFADRPHCCERSQHLGVVQLKIDGRGQARWILAASPSRTDPDGSSHVTTVIATATFCPFCGSRLVDPHEAQAQPPLESCPGGFHERTIGKPCVVPSCAIHLLGDEKLERIARAGWDSGGNRSTQLPWEEAGELRIDMMRNAAGILDGEIVLVGPGRDPFRIAVWSTFLSELHHDTARPSPPTAHCICEIRPTIRRTTVPNRAHRGGCVCWTREDSDWCAAQWTGDHMSGRPPQVHLLRPEQRAASMEIRKWLLRSGADQPVVGMLIGDRQAGKRKTALDAVAKLADLSPLPLKICIVGFQDSDFHSIQIVAHSAWRNGAGRFIQFASHSKIFTIRNGDEDALRQGNFNLVVLLQAERLPLRAMTLALQAVQERNGRVLLVASPPDTADGDWIHHLRVSLRTGDQRPVEFSLVRSADLQPPVADLAVREDAVVGPRRRRFPSCVAATDYEFIRASDHQSTPAEQVEAAEELAAVHRVFGDRVVVDAAPWRGPTPTMTISFPASDLDQQTVEKAIREAPLAGVELNYADILERLGRGGGVVLPSGEAELAVAHQVFGDRMIDADAPWHGPVPTKTPRFPTSDLDQERATNTIREARLAVAPTAPAVVATAPSAPVEPGSCRACRKPGVFRGLALVCPSCDAVLGGC